MSRLLTGRATSLAAQREYLARVLPSFRGEIRSSRLRSWGVVHPRPISHRYRIRIEYQMPRDPRVWVEEPPLQKSEGEDPPHIYEADRPCLFYPPDRSWTPDLLIAYTIVPWLLEWLVYYEVWLITGEWEGGGVPHGPGDRRGRRRYA